MSCTIDLRNTGDSDAASPIARVGIPAGLTLPVEPLRALVEAGTIAHFETGARELTLYWRRLAPGQTSRVAVDLVAEYPGTFTGPASRAYCYYDDEAKHWVEPLPIRVTAAR